MSVFSSGTGEESDPFQIENMVQLQYLDNIEDNHLYHEITTNIDASNTTT